MTNHVGNRDADELRTLAFASSLLATLVLGCGSNVDLGASVSPPDPVTDGHELSVQTTNLVKMNASGLSSLAIDDQFLYFGSSGITGSRLWRCQKSNCWATLMTIATGDEYTPAFGLNGGRFGWWNGMCDAPGCTNRISLGFPIWDDRFAYWFKGDESSIYRCEIDDCLTGPVGRRVRSGFLVASRAQPSHFKLAGNQLYWLDLVEGITRASVDGATPAERLTLSNVTEWSTARAMLQLSGDGGVSVIDLELDGAYIYAALNIGAQNAQTTLGCDTCTPGIAIARWQHSVPNAAREWVLLNDPDLVGLSHLRVFGGEVIWGTDKSNLYSCLAASCSASKRQIGVVEATSTVAPSSTGGPLLSDILPPEVQFIAVDEQSIFWVSVPCNPRYLECSATGRVDWTLKRTPRIAQ